MRQPKRWIVWLLRLVLMAVSAGGLWLTGLQAAAVADPFLRPPPAYPPPDDAALRETLLEATAAALIHDDVDARIRAALEADDRVLADIYIDLAELLGKPLAPGTVQLYRDQNTPWEQAKRKARVCWNGAARAEAGNLTALSCQLVTDLSGIGDVRDIIIEGGHYLRAEPVNTLVLGLSVAGLATTVLTVTTMGTAGVLDAGLAVVKLGVKTGRLGARLGKQLGGTFIRALDVSALQSVRRQDGLLAAARGLRSGRFFNHVAWQESARALDDIGTLRQSGRGLSTALLALEHSDTMTDLRFFRRVGHIFGKNTDGIIKVLGRRVFALGKATAKMTVKVAVKLAAWACGVLLSLLGLIASLFGNLAEGLIRRWLLGLATRRLGL